MNLQYKKKKNQLPSLILGLIMFISNVCAIAAGEINTNRKGIMLQGYDPVAYFLENEPLLGWSSIQANYQRGTYYFVSRQNRDRFIENAEKYTPAYGGFCSYGVRMGKKFNIDPHAWKIVNGVLYMQLNKGTQLIWNKDLKKNIRIADKIWPKIRSSPSSDLIGN